MAKKNITTKIYDCLVKRRYLNGKYVYNYKRLSVPIPSKFHDRVESFLGKRLNIHVKRQKDSIIIILTPVKTFLHTELPPDKT